MCSVLFTNNRKGQVELPEILHRSTQPQILEAICKFGRLNVSTVCEGIYTIIPVWWSPETIIVAQSVRLGCGLLFHSKRIIQYAILKRNSDEGKVERGVLNWFVPVFQIGARLQQTEEASEFDIGLPYALGRRNNGDEKDLLWILQLWNEIIATLG